MNKLVNKISKEPHMIGPLYLTCWFVDEPINFCVYIVNFVELLTVFLT